MAAAFAALVIFQIPLIEMSVDAENNACPGKFTMTGLIRSLVEGTFKGHPLMTYFASGLCEFEFLKGYFSLDLMFLFFAKSFSRRESSDGSSLRLILNIF